MDVDKTIDIKQYIKSNLYRKDGKLNSAILRQRSFLSSEQYNIIKNNTSFLKENCSITERIYCVLNDITCIQICPICQKNQRVFLPKSERGYSDTCNGKKCIAKNPNRVNKIIQSKIEKYGSIVSEKQLRIFTNNSKLYNQKSKETIKQKYGVENISQLPDHKNKVTKTLLDRYGVDHWMRSNELQTIVFERRLKKFKDCTEVIPPTLQFLVNYPNATDKYSFKCDKCKNEDNNISYYTVKWRLDNFGTTCSKCSELKYGSIFQNDVYDFINSLGIQCIRNQKCLSTSKKEVDILIPEMNIAFECNGLYWHSVEHLITTERSHLYDYDKFIEYMNNSIRIYCIMEDEWKNSKDIVKSRIKNILGKIQNKIYARKCVIKEVDPTLCNKFLCNNHIQGSGNSVYRLGAFFNNELISVMTFSRNNLSRKIKDTWEISRFCSKLDTNVVGIASKFVSYFEKSQNPNSLISYADRRWSDGKIYQKLGFTFSHNTKPNYWYIDKHNVKRIHRFSLRKTNQDPTDISEEDLRRSQGYLRIYDYGSSKWIKNL